MLVKRRVLFVVGLLILLATDTYTIHVESSICTRRILNCFNQGGYACQRVPGTFPVPCEVRCLSLSRVCDGVVQCPLGDDEMNCPFNSLAASGTFTNTVASTVTTRTTTTRYLATSVNPVLIIDSSETGVTSTSQIVILRTGSVISANQSLPLSATLCVSAASANGTTPSTATADVDVFFMTSQVVQLTITASAQCTATQVYPPTFVTG